MSLTSSDIRILIDLLGQSDNLNSQSPEFQRTLRYLLNKVSADVAISRKTDSYTLTSDDVGTMIEMNSADANTLTVPPHSSAPLPVGMQILVVQYGAGQTTIVAGDGVAIRSKDGALAIGGQYSAATLIKIAENEWYAIGDLTA